MVSAIERFHCDLIMTVVTQMRDVLKMFSDGCDLMCIITGTEISLSTFIFLRIKTVYRTVAISNFPRKIMVVSPLTPIKVALSIHW